MHHEFCTLLDSNYLLKGLALHASLERVCRSFRLTVFCFDDEARDLLGRLAPSIETVALSELEAFDHALAAVKPERSATEYCWTATPSLPRYMLAARPEIDAITYLDADLLFYSDPEPLVLEMGDGAVLITPHRFAPPYRHQELNGIYNVQFMMFRREARALEALEWWYQRCIEWCYARVEDGKFGDQKYLDDWPARFDGVHVLRHPGGGFAPWNAIAHDLTLEDGRLLVDGKPLIFSHFHGAKLRKTGSHDLHSPFYFVPERARELVFRPYVAELEAQLQRVRGVVPGFSRGVLPAPGPRERLARLRARTGEVLIRRLPPLGRLRYPSQRAAAS